jgi:hypothetical protein
MAVLIVQSVHMLEHVAQVIQKFALGQPEAHGLFGAIFDFESGPAGSEGLSPVR